MTALNRAIIRTERLPGDVDALNAGGAIDSSLLFNTFENVAFTRFSGLETARAHFLKLGAPFVHLAGSGPTLYTITTDKGRAEELCFLLEKQQMKSYLAEIPFMIEKTA